MAYSVSLEGRLGIHENSKASFSPNDWILTSLNINYYTLAFFIWFDILLNLLGWHCLIKFYVSGYIICVLHCAFATTLALFKRKKWYPGQAVACCPVHQKVAGSIPIRIRTGGNWLMFLSHWCFPLSLCLFLSVKSINVSLGEDFFKKEIMATYILVSEAKYHTHCIDGYGPSSQTVINHLSNSKNYWNVSDCRGRQEVGPACCFRLVFAFWDLFLFLMVLLWVVLVPASDSAPLLIRCSRSSVMEKGNHQGAGVVCGGRGRGLCGQLSCSTATLRLMWSPSPIKWKKLKCYFSAVGI